MFYKAKPPDTYSPTSLSGDISCYFLPAMPIPKGTLEFHTDQITALVFSNTQSNLLFSGSSDKFIALWKIQSPETLQGEKIRVIPIKSEITDMCLYPDDSHLFVSCFDNCIYILRTNLLQGTFDIVAVMSNHDNIVNSIALDPYIEENGRFASISDKGRFILASFNKKDKRIEIISNNEDFINIKHKCNIIQKKIDWSVDGRLLISVDHHYIRKQPILHARLVNMENPATFQVLIGHDSPVLIAKFSKCLYCERSNNSNQEQFQLCATSDKNGNLIIWKVEKDNFSVLVEISNYSESNVTNMLWTNSGDYLFTINSSGSVCAIEFSEFNIKVSSRRQENIELERKITKKKVIEPILITGPKNIIDDEQKELMEVDNPNNKMINNYQAESNPTNQNYPSCLRCKKQMYQLPENQVTNVIIEDLFTKDKLPVYLSWENLPFENYSIIKMKFGSSVLYANKYLNRLIKLFTCNNIFFGFYDTNFSLSVYSILNTPLISKMYFEEISLISSFANYILLLTSQNRLIVLNVFTQERITDEYLNINSNPLNIFQTKIDSIYFCSLDKILIKADTFNPYKNTSNKLILYFDQKNNNLIQSANSDFTQEEKAQIASLRNVRSRYNDYFSQNISEEGRKFRDLDLYKMSSTVDAIYDNIYKSKFFNNRQNVIKCIEDLMLLVRDDIYHSKSLFFKYIADDFCSLGEGGEFELEIKERYKELLDEMKDKMNFKFKEKENKDNLFNIRKENLNEITQDNVNNNGEEPFDGETSNEVEDKVIQEMKEEHEKKNVENIINSQEMKIGNSEIMNYNGHQGMEIDMKIENEDSSIINKNKNLSEREKREEIAIEINNEINHLENPSAKNKEINKDVQMNIEHNK